MEREEWKANPIVWPYFIPAVFFLLLLLFSHLLSIPKCTVGMWQAIKKPHVSQAAQNKRPYDVLLIPATVF